MRFLQSIVFISILHCTFAVQHLHVLNNCSETVNLCGSITGCITKLDAGQEYTYELSNRTHITFTNGEDGLTMAILGIEYMTYKGLDDYYGVNIAAGFDTGVQISSTKGAGVTRWIMRRPEATSR